METESELSRNDCSMIMEALWYAKQKVENYENYPSYDFKRGRIEVYEVLIAKMRLLHKAAKK